MEESYLLPQGMSGAPPKKLDPARLQGVSHSLKAACCPGSAGVSSVEPGGTFPGRVEFHGAQAPFLPGLECQLVLPQADHHPLPPAAAFSPR